MHAHDQKVSIAVEPMDTARMMMSQTQTNGNIKSSSILYEMRKMIDRSMQKEPRINEEREEGKG